MKIVGPCFNIVVLSLLNASLMMEQVLAQKGLHLLSVIYIYVKKSNKVSNKYLRSKSSFSCGDRPMGFFVLPLVTLGNLLFICLQLPKEQNVC